MSRRVFPANTTRTETGHVDLERLLAWSGATAADKLVGRAGRVVALFPSRPGPAIRQRDGALPGTKLFSRVPLAYLAALHFAWNDIALPVSAVRDDIPERHRPPGKLAVFNLRSGALSLGSVYGATGLGGDFSATLLRCLKWPWDRARLWVDATRGAGERQGDLLRLQRIVHGDGAILDEAFFDRLPTHLHDGFFADGDLRLNRAVIPEPRNDRTLILSQFHRAAIRFHNRAVDRLDAEHNRPSDRAAVFELAASATRAAFATAIVNDLLEAICDRTLLRWSRARRPGTRPAGLPVEAIALLPGLLSMLQPARIRLGERMVTNFDPSSEGMEDGLPVELFVSARVPTRLADDNLIDWTDFVGPKGQALAGTPSGKTWSSWHAGEAGQGLTLAASADIGSGQSCARFVNAEHALGLPVIPHRDALRCLGLARDIGHETDFFTYVLAEAELYGRNGRLGPLGSLTLAETLIGAAEDAGAETGRPDTGTTISEFLGA